MVWSIFATFTHRVRHLSIHVSEILVSENRNWSQAARTQGPQVVQTSTFSGRRAPRRTCNYHVNFSFICCSRITYWSHLKCLFSTPVWFCFILNTASRLSSSLRNLAFAGESGKKNLMQHRWVNTRNSTSFTFTRWFGWKLSIKVDLPEYHGSN